MATKTVVEGDLYMSISRKLHEIDRQLLQREGYPHDLEWLERTLQRATEGLFFPDDEARCSVSLTCKDPVRCLKSLRLENEEELVTRISGRPMSLIRPSSRHYRAWVTPVRLQRRESLSSISEMLERKQLFPASLEESCAFLEKNQTTQQNGSILCLDGFMREDHASFIIFSGNVRRRTASIRELKAEDEISAHMRVFAREQIVDTP